jgi:hypothetical protein
MYKPGQFTSVQSLRERFFIVKMKDILDITTKKNKLFLLVSFLHFEKINLTKKKKNVAKQELKMQKCSWCSQ